MMMMMVIDDGVIAEMTYNLMFVYDGKNLD